MQWATFIVHSISNITESDSMQGAKSKSQSLQWGIAQSQTPFRVRRYAVSNEQHARVGLHSMDKSPESDSVQWASAR